MSTINDSDLFLVNRSGSSYKQTFEDINDEQGNSSDLFLVNRGSTSYKLTRDELMNGTKLLDTDILLANRSGVSYKVTGADVKAGLVVISDLITAATNNSPNVVTFASATGLARFPDGSAVKQDASVTPVTSAITNVVNVRDFLPSTTLGGTVSNQANGFDGDPTTWVSSTVGNSTQRSMSVTFDPPLNVTEGFYLKWGYVHNSYGLNYNNLPQLRASATSSWQSITGVTTTASPSGESWSWDYRIPWSGSLEGFYKEDWAPDGVGANVFSVLGIDVDTVLVDDIGNTTLTLTNDTQLANFQPGDTVTGYDSGDYVSNTSYSGMYSSGTVGDIFSANLGNFLEGRPSGFTITFASGTIPSPQTRLRVNYTSHQSGTFTVYASDGTSQTGPGYGANFIISEFNNLIGKDITSMVFTGGNNTSNYGAPYYSRVAWIEVDNVVLIEGGGGPCTVESSDPASKQLIVDRTCIWDTGDAVTGPAINGSGTCDSKDIGAKTMTVSGAGARFAIGSKIEPN